MRSWVFSQSLNSLAEAFSLKHEHHFTHAMRFSASWSCVSNTFERLIKGVTLGTSPWFAIVARWTDANSDANDVLIRMITIYDQYTDPSSVQVFTVRSFAPRVRRRCGR
jgi:hypothetical protein